MNYQKVKQYRLPNFDYSGNGQYFVTICINERKHFFGRIENEKMILSELGKIVEQILNELPEKFTNVRLDAYQIMPDHFHGIIIIKENNKRNRLNREKLINQKNLINQENLINLPAGKAGQIPTGKSGIRNNPMELTAVTLGRIIRWFKGRVKFEANRLNPDFKWQSRFYDRIIRDEKEFYFISEYISNNVHNWGKGTLKKYFDE